MCVCVRAHVCVCVCVCDACTFRGTKTKGVECTYTKMLGFQLQWEKNNKNKLFVNLTEDLRAICESGAHTTVSLCNKEGLFGHDGVLVSKLKRFMWLSPS